MTATGIPEKTLTLIRRLHALAINDGATEAEAQTALEKMQKLLFEHNLTLDQVGEAPEDLAASMEKEFVSVQYRERFNPKRTFTKNLQHYERQWRVQLGDSIARYNFCAILSSNEFVGNHFIGTPQNIEAVREILALRHRADRGHLLRRDGSLQEGRRLGQWPYLRTSTLLARTLATLQATA